MCLFSNTCSFTSHSKLMSLLVKGIPTLFCKRTELAFDDNSNCANLLKIIKLSNKKPRSILTTTWKEPAPSALQVMPTHKIPKKEHILGEYLKELP